MIRLLTELIFKFHLPIIILVLVFFVFRAPLTKVYYAVSDKFHTLGNRLIEPTLEGSLELYTFKIDSLQSILEQDRKHLTSEQIEAINTQLADYFILQQVGKLNELGSEVQDYKTRLYRLYSVIFGPLEAKPDTIPE